MSGEPGPVRILCAADLHLGRRSTALPSGLAGPVHACTGAWDRIVELALRRKVDLILLAGDVVDLDNRYFEAVGPLERGLRKLGQAGIRTLAVAGNHDHAVLPPIARDLGPEALTLLGAEERWEWHTVQRGGRPLLCVAGWSFPQARVESSPLARFAAPPEAGLPLVGLLHADLGNPRSPYAPVDLPELHSTRLDAWVLGHIHQPRFEEEGAPVFYPGSPQAMDPGETGPHGVCLLHLDPPRETRVEWIPLSTVRYERIEVDLTGQEAMESARSVLVDAVRQRLREVAGTGGPLRYLSCRLRLTGRTPLHRQLPSQLERLPEDLELEEAGVRAGVERLERATRPALELDRLGRSDDAAGEVARLIRDLEGREVPETATSLERRVLEAQRSLHRHAPYLRLGDPEPDAAAARQLLLEAGYDLLDLLLRQKEGS